MDTKVLLGQATLRAADVWAWRPFFHFRYHP
jgi:hypothetical protein